MKFVSERAVNTRKSFSQNFSILSTALSTCAGCVACVSEGGSFSLCLSVVLQWHPLYSSLSAQRSAKNSSIRNIQNVNPRCDEGWQCRAFYKQFIEIIRNWENWFFLQISSSMWSQPLAIQFLFANCARCYQTGSTYFKHSWENLEK